MKLLTFDHIYKSFMFFGVEAKESLVIHKTNFFFETNKEEELTKRKNSNSNGAGGSFYLEPCS